MHVYFIEWFQVKSSILCSTNTLQNVQNYRRTYTTYMHELAVQQLQSGWRTESFGRTDVSHVAHYTHCQGIMAPCQRRLKIIHTQKKKHARYFAL